MKFRRDGRSGLLLPDQRLATPKVRQRGYVGPTFFGSGGGAATDPNFSSTIMLLDTDTNGSTTFTDKSAAAHGALSHTASNPVWDSSWTKFGLNSIYFDGNSHNLNLPDDTSTNWSSGDWSIEFWMKPVGVTGGVLVNKELSTGFYPYQCLITGASKLEFRGFDAANTALQYDLTSTTTLVSGTEYFVQLIRSGNTFSLNIGGAQEASSSYSGSLSNVSGSLPYWGTTGASSVGYNGRILNPRMTKGVARSVALQSAAWPTS